MIEEYLGVCLLCGFISVVICDLINFTICLLYIIIQSHLKPEVESFG